MKKNTIWLLTTLLTLSSCYSIAQEKKVSVMTDQERAYVADFLKETESGVFNSLKGLSDTQLKFKPAADQWSVEECVKHIAASEKELWTMAESALKQPANPEKAADIKISDEALVKAVEDRTQKSKTISILEPANAPYKTVAEALNDFKENRDKLIDYIKNTKENLGGHLLISPAGTYDIYQFILLISAHSNRHTQQIDEVKANRSFPK